MTTTLPGGRPGRAGRKARRLDAGVGDSRPPAALAETPVVDRVVRYANRPGTPANRIIAAAGGPRILRWARYTTASVVAGIISTGTLLVLYGLDLVSPQAASVIAFLAGAVPNYLLSRAWTWRGRNRRKPLREIVPYAAIVVATTVAAAMLTGVTDEHVHLLTSLRWLQVLLVGGVFVGTYVAMFVVKFLLLDWLVFTAGKSSQ